MLMVAQPHISLLWRMPDSADSKPWLAAAAWIAKVESLYTVCSSILQIVQVLQLTESYRELPYVILQQNRSASADSSSS